jgi:hypothetical protein
MSFTPPAQWPVRKVPLSPPPLSDLVPAIRSGLQSNFVCVTVEIAASPDLRQPPFHLAAPGLSGHPRVADVGGPLYLAPGPDLTKKYDLLSIAQQMEMSPDTGCLIGAGAGPFHVLGQNAELMPNLAYEVAAAGTSDDGDDGDGSDRRRLNNQTHYAKITKDGSYLCEKIGSSTTEFGLMANLFGSDGLPGPLLHITAKSRKGPLNFTAAIQQSLRTAFGDRLISLGGVFVVHRGTVNMHVMPDFPEKPFTSRSEVGAWLKYFAMPAPMVCLSVLHSGDDADLNLRMEHTHGFSIEEGRGGHYHGDLEESRDEVEYEGWFNVAEVLYRIDQPGLS